MTSLRTNVELLIHAGERLAPCDRTALLRNLDRQSVELSELVVDLARPAGTDEAPVRLDLAEVAAGAVDRARARTSYAHITLDARPVTITGQPAGLERAVVNLLDDAVKFPLRPRVNPRSESDQSPAEVLVCTPARRCRRLLGPPTRPLGIWCDRPPPSERAVISG